MDATLRPRPVRTPDSFEGCTAIRDLQCLPDTLDRERQKAFCSACKQGHLETVKRMLDEGDVNVNMRDEWDAVPLYYACYGGHLDVVQLLINNGARCQPGTVEGEGCMYGALNDAIRAILRRYRRTVVIHQDRYSQFIRALFTSCPLSDCTITIGGELPLSARFYGPLALSAPSPSSPLPAADLPSPAAPSGVRSASPRTQQVACGFPAVSDASWPWRGDDAEDWFVLVDRLSLPRGNADHLTQIGGAGPGCIPLNRRHASHGHAASSFIQEHRSRGFSGQDSRGERRRSRAYRPFGAMRRSRRSPSQRLIKKDSDRTARADSRSASLLSLLFERNIRPLSLRRPSARHLSRGLSGAAPPPRYEADQPADRGGAPQRRLERLCSMQNESYYSSPAPDSAHPSSLAFHRPARGSVASVSYRQADSFSSRVQASDQAQDRPESSFFPHGSRSTSLPAFSFASLPGRACRSTEASEDPRFLPHVSGSLESSSPVSTCDPAAGPAPDGRRPLSLDFVSQILRNPYVAALPVHAVRLAPDATVVNAHKLILACRSPFFHEELSKSYCLSRSLLNIPLSRGGNSRASKAPRGPGASHGANEHGEGRRQIPGGADVCGGAAAHMAGLGFRVRRSSETSPDRSLSCNPNVASVQRPAACSPVAELLKSHPSMLLQLIRYLYADEVEIPLKDVSAFVKLAKAFRLEDLWKRVEEEKTCIDSHMHRQSSRKVLAAPQTLGLSPRKDFPAILAGDLRSAVVSIFRHAEKQLHAIQLAQEKAPRSSRSDGDDGGGGSAGRCQKPRRGRHETSGGAAERPANGMWRGAGRSRNIHGKRGMEQTATESDELEDSRGGHREERQGLTLSVDSQEPEAKAEVIPSGCAEELGEKRARQLTHDEDLTFKNQSQHSTEEGGAHIKQEQTQGEAQTTKPRGVKERGEDRTPHLSLSGMTEERAAAGDQQNRKETCKASLEAGAEKQEPGGDCGKNEGFVDVFLSCADLCVYVGASQTPFPCHRFIVEKRSEYLATLLHSSFREVKVPPPCPVVLDGTLSPLDLSSCARPRAPGDRCLENSSSPLSSAPSSFLSSETRPPYLPAAASSASRCPLRSCPPSSSASSAVSSSAPYSSVSPPCVASTSCSRTSPPSPSRLDSTPSSLSVRSPVAASFHSLPSPLPPCRLIRPVIAASSVSDSSACCASTVSAGSVNSTRAPLRRRTSHSPPHPLQGEPARSSSLPSSSALLSVSSAAAARPAALPSPASKEEGTAQDARWTGRSAGAPRSVDELIPSPGLDSVAILELPQMDVCCFALMLEYMYTETVLQVPSPLVQAASDQPSETLLRLMEYGSMYFMRGLVNVCAALLSPLVDVSNVCRVYTAANLLRLDRLLFRCAAVMAESIDALLPRRDFHDLVLSSAHSVENREEVDSIPVVEEITDALAQIYGIAQSPEETEGALEVEWTLPPGVLPFTSDGAEAEETSASRGTSATLRLHAEASTCLSPSTSAPPSDSEGAHGRRSRRGDGGRVAGGGERAAANRRARRQGRFGGGSQRLRESPSQQRTHLPVAPDVLLMRSLYQEKAEQIDQLLAHLQLDA